jgi:redox-sensitive bicupin YhaK (pirin superfamily)
MATSADRSSQPAQPVDATSAGVELIVDPRDRDLGDGFVVRRLLPSSKQRAVGPFLFFDHFGPVRFPPGHGMDVRPHPHINLATVTYLFDGAMVHRDSLGSVQEILPGDINWMTAGRGIVHSERTGAEVRAAGFSVHGLQLWIGLPREHEEVAPAFHHYPAATIPVLRAPGVQARVLAGSAFGLTSPVKTLSRVTYLDVQMDAGSSLTLPPDDGDRACTSSTESSSATACRLNAHAWRCCVRVARSSSARYRPAVSLSWAARRSPNRGISTGTSSPVQKIASNRRNAIGANAAAMPMDRFHWFRATKPISSRYRLSQRQYPN